MVENDRIVYSGYEFIKGIGYEYDLSEEEICRLTATISNAVHKQLQEIKEAREVRLLIDKNDKARGITT